MLRRRLQAMADETELLRAHSVENVLIRRQRSGPLAPLLHLSVSDDPAENSKQGLTALKCVDFSRKQVVDMLRRLQAVAYETELNRSSTCCAACKPWPTRRSCCGCTSSRTC
ncbi:hypothetical protein PF003_g20341 [Phytophthora fragariae]|nr:hypothetical protein PF003_g20341 [Phytophthora fragariae]